MLRGGHVMEWNEGRWQQTILLEWRHESDMWRQCCVAKHGTSIMKLISKWGAGRGAPKLLLAFSILPVIHIVLIADTH